MEAAARQLSSGATTLQADSSPIDEPSTRPSDEAIDLVVKSAWSRGRPAGMSSAATSTETVGDGPREQ